MPNAEIQKTERKFNILATYNQNQDIKKAQTQICKFDNFDK